MTISYSDLSIGYGISRLPTAGYLSLRHFLSYCNHVYTGIGHISWVRADLKKEKENNGKLKTAGGIRKNLVSLLSVVLLLYEYVEGHD